MHSNTPAIGASGAIAGVMGAYFVLYPHAKIKILIINQVVNIPAYLYLGVWISLQILFGTIYLSQGVQSGVGWFAHIGGFLSGLILMWVYKKKS
jgi:membrane associated rhomboid family serine protease